MGGSTRWWGQPRQTSTDTATSRVYLFQLWGSGFPEAPGYIQVPKLAQLLDDSEFPAVALLHTGTSRGTTSSGSFFLPLSFSLSPSLPHLLFSFPPQASFSDSSLSTKRTRCSHQVRVSNPGSSPHLRSLQHIFGVPFSCEPTYSQALSDGDAAGEHTAQKATNTVRFRASFEGEAKGSPDFMDVV